MWVFSQSGFFSIVTPARGDCDVPGVLAVRSRYVRDVESFMRLCQCVHSSPVNLPERDYEWRAYAKAEDVAQWLAAEALRIDYDNFKNRVAATQGELRAMTYGQIWAALYESTHELARRVAGAVRRARP